MSEDSQIPDRFRKRAVLELAGMSNIEIRRNIPFGIEKNGVAPVTEALTMDIYYPPHAAATPGPVVIYVMGYPDPDGMIRKTGMGDSWARLAASSGFAMVLYANREPTADAAGLVEHITTHASELNIDPHRLGVFAMSGNACTAIRLAMQKQWQFRFVALNCGYTLDADGGCAVADAAAQYGFANASAGKSIDDLPQDLPLLLTRAGKDEFAGLNDTMDRFIAAALKRNLPLTVVNQPTGPHGFDLFEDSDVSREIIRQTLAFMKFHLTRD